MNWISESPYLVLVAVTLVAFLESFALLGVFVPGVVLLFSLAAIAHNLEISILMLLFSAGIGALIGDISSFYIGRHFQHTISHWSWFKRHQNWLEQGEWFIKRWGWLSVIVGRFLGPLRPVIPLTAGTLGMKPNVFVPLSLITVTFWAPTYLLPGYYTGELTELWRLQPLSTRSLIIYFLTAIAISGMALAVYHHTHPDRWHLKGWITKHQADRWPFAALCLGALSICCYFLLEWMPLNLQDQRFLEWSNVWKQQQLTDWWLGTLALSGVDFIALLFSVMTLWLLLGDRIALGFIAAITYSLLQLTLKLDTHLSGEPLRASPYGNYASFVFLTGFISTLMTSRIAGLRRWPVYALASFIILTLAISNLWNGTLALTEIGQAAALGLLFASLLRISWKTLHLPLKLPNIGGLILLLSITSFAFAVLSFV